MHQPTASPQLIEKRALLLQQLRAFFAARHVLEVDVPVLGLHTVTDVNLSALAVQVGIRPHYLQTSPEYFLKRLIARDRRCVYYLGKAFRADESGRRHRAEFTMLEWYRMGFDDAQLIDEIIELVRFLCPEVVCEKVRYADLFKGFFGLNPHTASERELADLAKRFTSFEGDLDDVSSWLDLLFSLCIEPTLIDTATIVYDFPAVQCALARIAQDVDGNPVAKRFELYWRGLELANGYWELCSLEEQADRFHRDGLRRAALGLPIPEVDPLFMAALANGLPDCAGVALGVDRLLMCLTGQTDIEQVMPFANG